MPQSHTFHKIPRLLGRIPFYTGSAYPGQAQDVSSMTPSIPGYCERCGFVASGPRVLAAHLMSAAHLT
eukprot:771985-Prorocentrum_minimum.AAC.1